MERNLEQFVEVQGEIALSPRGENGFGWDKIFIPNGLIRHLLK